MCGQNEACEWMPTMQWHKHQSGCSLHPSGGGRGHGHGEVRGAPWEAAAALKGACLQLVQVCNVGIGIYTGSASEFGTLLFFNIENLGLT